MKSLLPLLMATLVCAIAVLLLAGRHCSVPSAQSLHRLEIPHAMPRHRVLRQNNDATGRDAADTAWWRAPSRESVWRIWRSAARTLKTSTRPAPAYDMWPIDVDDDPTKDTDACERIYVDSKHHQQVCAISI